MLTHLFHLVLGLVLIGIPIAVDAQPGMFTGKTGTVRFNSDAPLEFIEAESRQLSGAINPETNDMAFSVRINSFRGFNSVVQREHFMENYMEVTQCPVATFTGKIIESIKFDQSGHYDIRVKGLLNIHGVNTERIISGTLMVDRGTLRAQAMFSVPLKEHDITVPKLLSQKIAETIYVHLEMTLQKAG